MKSMEEYYVPWVKGIPMYVSAHIDLAWEKPTLRRMMSNENPNPPSKKVLEAIEKYAKIANRYPDQGFMVRKKIADINHLPGIENVMLGNGSSEVFDNVFRCLLEPGDEVIQHTPCFGIYKLRCDILGGKLVSVPMAYKNKQLLFDVDAIIKAITPKTKVIVIANPNNPTGNFIDKEDFIKLAKTGLPLISDEAYIEFDGLGKSFTGLIKDYKNVIVIRTMSKCYGLAGLRFGYALGDKDVISQFSAALLPWNVGTITMWAALAGFEDTEGLQERADFNNREVAYIENSLKDIKGLDIFHSYGNYVLFDGTDAGKEGKDMLDFALKRGLILRAQKEMYGRKGWFRITVGTAEENKLAVQAVRDFFSQ